MKKSARAPENTALKDPELENLCNDRGKRNLVNAIGQETTNQVTTRLKNTPGLSLIATALFSIPGFYCLP
ncbi:MAG: hypothetical protein P8Y42_05665 [Exilibacterium sp.]